MGQSVTYPDGSVLTSDALTIPEISSLIQQLTLGMLGYPVVNNSNLVRIAWATQGQPFQNVGDDICYVRCVPKDDPYDKMRYRFNESDTDPNLLEQWNYTRVWKVCWTFYGPNSTDLARALRSGLYQDYFTNALQLDELFTVSEISQEVRVPELIDGQWFERVDIECEMYEWVSETITRQTVTSAETILRNADGVILDFTTTAS